MNAPYPRKRTVKRPRRRLLLPDHVLRAFKGKAFLNLSQLAFALGYSSRSLLRHCAEGHINWHQRGVGTTNRFRAFTLRDVEEFWNRTERMDHDALNERRRKAREEGRRL